MPKITKYNAKEVLTNTPFCTAIHAATSVSADMGTRRTTFQELDTGLQLTTLFLPGKNVFLKRYFSPSILDRRCTLR